MNMCRSVILSRSVNKLPISTSHGHLFAMLSSVLFAYDMGREGMLRS